MRVQRGVRAFAALAAFVFVYGASAEESLTVDLLLARDQRPTMIEIARVIPTRNEDLAEIARQVQNSSVVSGGRLGFTHWLKVLRSTSPRLIAHLERTFPGATFAFMGRDTQVLADVFEAFFSGLGQDIRVVRLGLSKKSFIKTPRENLVDFLASNGFSLDRVGVDHPYILVDTVSKGGGRQGRTLIDAAYSEYARRGGQPADLVRYFTMVGLVVSTFQQDPVPLLDSEKIYQGMASHLRSLDHASKVNYGLEHMVLNYIDESNQLGNEAGYDHFTGAWHESYSDLRIDLAGKISATPGAAETIFMRKAILHFQQQILDFATTPEFLEEVRAEARRIGYEFTTTRPDATRVVIPPISPALPSTQAEIEKLIAYNDLSVSPDDQSWRDYMQKSLAVQFDTWDAGRLENRARASTWVALIQNRTHENRFSPNAVFMSYMDGMRLGLERRQFTVEQLQPPMSYFSKIQLNSAVVESVRGLLNVSPELAKSLMGDDANFGLMNGTLEEKAYLQLMMALNGVERVQNYLCATAFERNDFY